MVNDKLETLEREFETYCHTELQRGYLVRAHDGTHLLEPAGIQRHV